MPECAAALLADGPPPDDTPGDVVDDDLDPDVDGPAGDADGGDDGEVIRGDAGAQTSGIPGNGRRGRRDEGCQTSLGGLTGLRALLRR